MSAIKSTRFDLLDGLRGVAAIAVMLHHYTQHTGWDWFGGAWVAVDLFFVLSGFVIAHSYSKKLLNGMSFREFAFVRLVRLAPLYLLGLALGVCAVLLSMAKTGTPHISGTQLATATVLGAAWLPYFNNIGWPFGTDAIVGATFPLNDPSWSLFFELFVNVVFAAYLYKFRKLPNARYSLLAFIAFIACTIIFRQINPGWRAESFLLGFPRVIAEFFAGVFIFSAGLQFKKPHIVFTATITIAALACFAIGNPKVAFVNSLTLVPLSVALLCSVSIEGIGKGVCQVLGELSYPLYVIHFPVYRLVFESFDIRALNPVAQTLVVAGISIVLALLLARADQELRRKLTSFIKAKSPAAAV
ncbi:acyltransferase family protein [Caballeronia sp. KNU42]